VQKPLRGIAPFPRKRFEAFLRVCKVQTKDFGLQPFRMLGTQRYVLDQIEAGLADGKTSFVVLKARQLGMSTFFILLDIFWAFEHPGLSGALATHTDQSREQFRATVETFFAHLPPTHKIAKHAHNRLMLVLKNGSSFSYLVAGVKTKATAGLGRSGAYNYSHLSEVAFWGSEDDLTELEATMSQHYPHRLQVIESTANGFNFYEDLWKEAKKSPVTGAIFCGWWRNELYAFQLDDPRFAIYMPEGVEKPAYSALERKRIRMVKERYGFDIQPQQMAWYRWMLEEKQRGDQMSADEKYPFIEEDAFVATGSKFFSSETLTDAMRAANVLPYMPFKYRLGEDWTETQIVDATKIRGREDLRVWELADPQGRYVIGCDPAFGSSETADRTGICVCRCWADRLIQVAEYASPTTLTYQCAWVLCHLAGYYRQAMVNLEISGPGTTVFQEMLHLQRQAARNLRADGQASDLRDIFSATAHFLYRRPDSMRGDLAYQWRMSHENKHALMCSYRDSFQLGRYKVSSMPCLEEMRGMVYEEGSVYAEGSKKDDRCIAAGLAHEAWKRFIQPQMLANGFTYASWLKQREGQKASGTARTVERHINYLQQLGKTRVLPFH
jgi:hypothetical protein